MISTTNTNTKTDGVSLEVPDWHKPSNTACEQNQDAGKACTCEPSWRERVRGTRKHRKERTKWVLRITDSSVDHGMRSQLHIEVHNDGKMWIREAGRRIRYELKLGAIYSRAVKAHAVAVAAEAKQRRHAKRKSVKAAKRIAQRLAKKGGR